MSIKYRIALLFASLVTLLFALISMGVYFFSAAERGHLFKSRLKNRALSTARIYAGIEDSNYAILRKIDAAAVASLYNKSITITSLNNIPGYVFSDKPGDYLLLSTDIIEQTKINNEHNFTYLGKQAVAIHLLDGNSNFIVAVAAEDTDGLEYLSQLKKILLFSLGLSVLLSFAGGIVFAKSLIRPISHIINEANLITATSFSKRIKVNDTGDELTKLAITFNDLLDRLQESFAIQRRFIANASHELSTPLTSVSSQLEVALQKERVAGEYKSVLQSIHEDIKALQQLTHSLLDIAKTGSEGGIDLSEIRLDEILLKVISDIQKQNQRFRITLDFTDFPEDEKKLTVFGNGNLLHIALKNIIENGCKYAEDGNASVTVFFDQAAICIRVFNKGDVIAEADIQHIFQPFFRAGTVAQKPGFGLGLTLAKRIIAMHKGIISVESDVEKGTMFIISLPNG